MATTTSHAAVPWASAARPTPSLIVSHDFFLEGITQPSISDSQQPHTRTTPTWPTRGQAGSGDERATPTTPSRYRAGGPGGGGKLRPRPIPHPQQPDEPVWPAGPA